MKKIFSVILFLTAIIVIGGCGNGPTKTSNISDFDYELSEGNLKITEYNGKSEVLEIKSSYEIDDSVYKTDLSEFQIGIGNSKVASVILEDGIEEINDAAFNSCDVKNVFFPKSMRLVYDNTLSYLHPDEGEKIRIYYAGTKDEWDEIFTEYERKTVKEAWESSDNPDEKASAAGKALAQKLNGMMGEYDGSKFEYFFSASPDDLR